MVVKDLTSRLMTCNRFRALSTGSVQLCKQAVMRSRLKLQNNDDQCIALFYGQLHLQVLQVLLIYSWHELYLARACQAGLQVAPNIDGLWVQAQRSHIVAR